MTRPPHLVFAGGGTAGQLYPGLAVAAHVADRLPEATITFVGPGSPAERHAVRAAGFIYASLPSQPSPQGALRAVRFVTDNVAGYLASRWFLKERGVSLVVGLGGYGSAATVRAAGVRGIPTVLLEQNAVPGQATRWLANSATAVCAGFSEARRYFGSHVPLTVTGNPARQAFERFYRQQQAEPVLRLYPATDECGVADVPRVGDEAELTLRPTPSSRRLIVIGGAGGARSLNESMPRALQCLESELAGWQIIHQSGEGQLQGTELRYRQSGVDALVVSYIDEMAPIMFEADLVVCRSSGTTLAELALAGVPAVLVPYPGAADACQMANAQAFAAGGAAVIIDENNLPGTLDEALARQLQPLMRNSALRGAMASAMRSMARPDAAAEITSSIERILCGAAIPMAA